MALDGNFNKAKFAMSSEHVSYFLCYVSWLHLNFVTIYDRALGIEL